MVPGNIGVITFDKSELFLTVRLFTVIFHLAIAKLAVPVAEETYLEYVSTIKNNEIHTLMGLNGSGKSTICKVLMGDPTYKVISTHTDKIHKAKSFLHQAIRRYPQSCPSSFLQSR